MNLRTATSLVESHSEDNVDKGRSRATEAGHFTSGRDSAKQAIVDYNISGPAIHVHVHEVNRDERACV